MPYPDVSSGNVDIQNDHEDQLSLGENILQVVVVFTFVRFKVVLSKSKLQDVYIQFIVPHSVVSVYNLRIPVNSKSGRIYWILRLFNIK